MISGMGVDAREEEFGIRLSRYLRYFKPMLDIALVLLSLPLTLPIIAVLAAMVKLTSPGPALLRLNCIGREGRNFRQWRLRSVYLHSVANGQQGLGTADDRNSALTPLGRFMIRTQLNRLPQIFNVLAGEMSLVGPCAEAGDPSKQICATTQMMLLVRPGIFGPEQLMNDARFNLIDRRSLILAYVAEAGFRTDLRVMFAATMR